MIPDEPLFMISRLTAVDVLFKKFTSTGKKKIKKLMLSVCISLIKVQSLRPVKAEGMFISGQRHERAMTRLHFSASVWLHYTQSFLFPPLLTCSIAVHESGNYNQSLKKLRESERGTNGRQSVKTGNPSCHSPRQSGMPGWDEVTHRL